LEILDHRARRQATADPAAVGEPRAAVRIEQAGRTGAAGLATRRFAGGIAPVVRSGGGRQGTGRLARLAARTGVAPAVARTRACLRTPALRGRSAGAAGIGGGIPAAGGARPGLLAPAGLAR